MVHERLSVLFISDAPEENELIQKVASEIPGTPALLRASPADVEGMQRLSEGRFDAVILEGASSGKNRLDDLRDASSMFPHTPIIYYRSDDREDLARAALDQGAVDYLLKRDVNRHTLMRSIRYVCASIGDRGQIGPARFEEILENAPIGIIFVDMDGVVVYQNRASRIVAGDGTSEETSCSVVGTDILSLPGVTWDERSAKSLRGLLSGTPFSRHVIPYPSTAEGSIMMEI